MENFEPNFSEETVEIQGNQENYGDFYTSDVDVQQEEKKTLGVISLILSIASICCCCGGGPLAIAAVILSCVDKSKNGKMSGLAKAGLIIAIVSFVIGVIIGVVFGVIGAFGNAMSMPTYGYSGYYY